MTSWRSFRKGLDLDPSLTFLNCAATSPTIRATRDAVQAFESDRARRAEEGWDDWVRGVDAARHSTASYFGARPEEIAFLSNTGHGINTVARMIPWRRGDEVVVNDLEFPSNLLPWTRLERSGVRVRVVPSVDGRLAVEDLEAAITAKTRLLALSWVSYRNGQRFPLKRLADAVHEREGLFFVDAIPGAGALRPDFGRDGVDFLACGGHKWLMAPFGVGTLIVQRELVERFDPPFPGWQSREDPDDFSIDNETWAKSARRFEIGNLNYGGIAGWRAAVDAIAAVDDAPRRVHALGRLVRRLATDAGLDVSTPEPAEERAGVTCIQVRDPVGAKAALARDGISVSVRGQAIRLSTHFWNTEDEVEHCLSRLVAWQRRRVSPKAF
jgi:cysteine desulfurase / selenocysteine lyase